MSDFGQSPPTGDGAGRHRPLETPITVITLVVIILLAIAAYLWSLPPDQRYTIEGTRPILVFTLILGNLGFGALMIGRVLYADGSAEELNARFRLAREIFLVFAGTLGTVIGFYFGSAKEGGPAVAPLSAAVAFADGKVVATLQGGAGPFIGYVQAGPDAGGDLLLRGEERSLSATVPGGKCPDGAIVIISDGRGQRAEAKLACAKSPSEPGATNSNETAAATPTNTTAGDPGAINASAN